MSGLVGVWNVDGRPVDKRLVESLSATLAHRGPDGEGVWTDGPVGLACRLLRVTPESAAETQPLVGPSGPALVFDGRIDNREELLAALGPEADVGRAPPDPALILAAYEAFGETLPGRLAGDFALGLFDPRSERLLLARDALGVAPLYYCRAGRTVLFASEIKALLAHPAVRTRPNDDLLADFLINGSGDAGGLTLFDGVSSVLPGHLVIVTPRTTTTRRYWDFDTTKRIRCASFGEYAEGFREHFDRAVRRRLRSAGPVAVSVSGGLDSSSIFCLAETLARGGRSGGHPPIGVSYVSPAGTPSDERAFLVEIERAYGVAIERVAVGEMGPFEGAREVVRHVEAPFLDDQWNTTQRFLDAVRRRGARVLLTGHWADQLLFPQAYLIDLFRRLAWRQVAEHLGEFGRWLTDADPRYFRKRFLLDLVKYHVPRVAVPWLRRLRGAPDARWFTDAFVQRARRRALRPPAARGPFARAHTRALYEEVRSTHHVACMEWNNKVAAKHGLTLAFPFLDRDLVSFLMAIPGEVQTRHGVPKALLREAMRDVLPAAIVHRRWKADFGHLVTAGMERDFPRLVEYFQSSRAAVAFGYVASDALRRELDRSRNGLRGPGCEAAWRLADLLGLELWLETFFGGER